MRFFFRLSGRCARVVPVPRFQIDRVSWRFRRLAMTSLPTGIRTPQSRHSCLFSFISPHRLRHCHPVLTGAYLLTIDSWAAFRPRISVYTLNNTATICFVAVTLRGKSFARQGTSQSVCHSGPNNPRPASRQRQQHCSMVKVRSNHTSIILSNLLACAGDTASGRLARFVCADDLQTAN